MSAFYIVLGILLLLSALFLIVAVLLQNGKSKGISGAITGGAETFFGKSKAKSMDKKLAMATTIIAIVFVVLVIIAFIFQDPSDVNKEFQDWLSQLIANMNTGSLGTDTSTGLVTDSSVSSTLTSDIGSALN
ncbi:MAG: preprotein translocase subunit SecG [Clostridia bacterium]|nr:preprotein translocase subunit SecG [Clostridia bacterium]